MAILHTLNDTPISYVSKVVSARFYKMVIEETGMSSRIQNVDYNYTSGFVIVQEDRYSSETN